MRNSTKRRGIQCYLCNQKFPTKSILLEHFDKYHTVSMFKSSKCGKHFSSKGTFYSHLQNHKCGLYACQICNSTFDLCTSWYNHMKSHHTKKYTCQVLQCNYTCKSESTFREHCNYFHLPQKTVPCTKCKKLFQLPMNMYYH